MIFLFKALLLSGLGVTSVSGVRPHISEPTPAPPPKWYGNHEYGKRCGCSYAAPNLKQNDCCAKGLLCDPDSRTCRVAAGNDCKETTIGLGNRKCAKSAYGPQKDFIACAKVCCVASPSLETRANPTPEIMALHKPINGALSSCCSGMIKVQEIDGKHYEICTEHED